MGESIRYVTDGWLTEAWLREVGFKWHWFAGQPHKHWLLWLGYGLQESHASTSNAEDIGIELSIGRNGKTPWWFCWLRSGGEHTCNRLIHVRHMSTKRDVALLVEGITGQRWNPENHYYGSMLGPKQARRERFA